MRKWENIDMEKLAEELIGRNGKFHVMMSFMGIALMPALVLDRTGRVIYLNKLAELHWKVKLTHVIGKQFTEILNLNDKETAREMRESKMVLAGTGPRVFIEMLGTSKPVHSILKFPFVDDDDDTLLGAFILPMVPTP